MDFLNSACIPPELITATSAPQAYLDDFAIPCGFPTLFGVAGGSGKTTALMRAAITAASTGEFPLFGMKKHDRPLRCVLVFGEESSDGLGKKIAHELKAIEHYKAGITSGNLKMISWEEFMDKQEQPQPIFDKEAGALTEAGEKLFKDLIDFRPDFVVFDTLKSLSQADYNMDTTAYRTMSELRKLARRSGAAVVMTTHLTKAGQDKITPDSNPGDMLALLKGSGSLVDASRHTIVLLPAKRDAYKNIEVTDKDLAMMTAVKTNVPGCDLNAAIFPSIRSSEQRTFVAVDGTGKPLIKVHTEAKTALRGILHNNLPNYIKLAAQIRRPFAISQKSATSVETLSRAALAEFFPENIDAQMVSGVLEELEAQNIISRCTTGRTGTGGVWDVPEGDYANQHEHEKRMRKIRGNKNYKLPFNAGAPSVEDFKNGLIDMGDQGAKQEEPEEDLDAILTQPEETPEPVKDEQDIEVPF